MTAENVAETLLAGRIPLTAFLRSLVRDRATAEDLFQEVTVRAVAECGTFKDERHLSRWARKVGRHRAIDFLRRAENRNRVFDSDVIELLAAEAVGGEPSPAEGASDKLEALGECIERLSPKCREVIEMRYGREMSGQDVARELGRKSDTVYKMLARSYTQLRECIEIRLRGRGEVV